MIKIPVTNCAEKIRADPQFSTMYMYTRMFVVSDWYHERPSGV